MLTKHHRLIPLVLLTLALASCVHAPPTLSPAATVAFNNTRVIKGLDLLRDTVVGANAQVPPLVATETARKVVLYHQTALTVMQAAQAGWQAAVLAGLNRLAADLPAKDRPVVAPYVALVKTILAEVQR